jgi:Flp pilus assembly protein TadG
MIRSEKGVSAVEFALIAPLLFVLTFGIVEFGLLLFDKAVVTNASREGARAAIVFNVADDVYTPLTDTEIKDIVKTYANGDDGRGHLVNLGGTSNLLTDADIDIDPSEENRVSEGDITVTVTFTYDFLVFPDLTELLGGSFDGSIDLVGRTKMRME